MKRILGVVAEYDPFHNGHEKHLRLARERVQPDFTYVVISGWFKQRGNMAMLSPYDRAACALAAGADAVFMLPTAWTVRDAEHYALGAVSLLAGLGATHMSYGTENSDPELPERIAEKINNPSPEFQKEIRAFLAEGDGYPRSVEKALSGEIPEASGFLNQPNNTLAVCYLRAIGKLGVNLTTAAVRREGSYRAVTIDCENPSASAVRAALRRGDYLSAGKALPDKCRETVRRAFLEHRIPEEAVSDHILIRTLRVMEPETASQLPDVSEGLEDRILRAARGAKSRNELLDAVCTRRYPRARISRICAWAVMGVSRSRLESIPLPEETLLLGMKRNPEMTAAWRDVNIRICSSPKELPPDPAWKFWSQCAGLTEDWFYRQKLVTV